MSEDQALMDRIAKIAGEINRTKAESQTTGPASSWNKPTPTLSNESSSWGSSRVAPYGRGRGRAGRVAPKPHRNRTLVLNNKTRSTSQYSKEASSAGDVKEEDEGANTLPQAENSWITKRDRHMQLINSTIYDKQAQSRNKAIEETRQQKVARRNQREKQKIQRHLQSIVRPSGYAMASPSVHEITIHGLRFHVLDGGSKLARIRDSLDSGSSTPKQANIGGVTFMRSRNGNLYRSGMVKAKKGNVQHKKINEPCKRFTSTGIPSFAPSYMSMRIVTASKAPTARTFTIQLKWPCAKTSSRQALARQVIPATYPMTPPLQEYPLVYISFVANVPILLVAMPMFASTLPPQSVETLPLLATAPKERSVQSDMFTNAQKNTAGSVDDDDIDLSSDDDDEMDSDDVDSDGLEDSTMDLSGSASSHALSQQQDYVRF